MCEGVTPTFDAGVVTDVVLARRPEPGPLASSMRPRRHSFEPSRSGQVTPREVASRTDLVTQLITSAILSLRVWTGFVSGVDLGQ